MDELTTIAAALPLNVLIIQKSGEIKLLQIKQFRIEDLYKKCGFKKGEDMVKIFEWTCTSDNDIANIYLYGKLDGKENMENNYIWPIPMNTKIYGNCVLVAKNHIGEYINLDINIWNTIQDQLKNTTTNTNTNTNTNTINNDNQTKTKTKTKTKVKTKVKTKTKDEDEDVDIKEDVKDDDELLTFGEYKTIKNTKQ